MPKRLLVLFDGNAIIHRAFHALPPFTLRKTGETVGAVYGFASMLLKVLNELKPSNCAIAFDKKGPTFRHALYHEYKAQRPATPDELVNQIGRVRQVVEAFGIPIFELDGYEADDVLGALSCQASDQGIDTVIVTGDADTMQLVSDRARVLYPKAGRAFSDTVLFDAAAVKAKYGVAPEHITDLKALVGDPSDNIPGVRGIGDKTAVRLIHEFGSLEKIYESLDEVTPPKLQALLRENEGIARQSKELATIDCEAPVKLVLEDCQARYDRKRVGELFRELEFFSLISRVPGTADGAEEAPRPALEPRLVEGDYRLVPGGDEETPPGLTGAGFQAVAVRGTSASAMSARLEGLAVSAEEGKAYYLPLADGAQPPREAMERLKKLFELDTTTRCAHNTKYVSIVLLNTGISPRNFDFDVSIAAHLLGEKALELKDITFSRLGLELRREEPARQKQLALAFPDLARAVKEAGAEADVVLRLARLLSDELDREGLRRLFTGVEMPLVATLVNMERNGVLIDARLLGEMSRRLGKQLVELEVQIYNNAGHQFNINSPQQLGNVLFNELGLALEGRGRGRLSTEAAVLEELRGAHPIINLILEYRQLAKLKSTYIDALPGLVNERTGRVHTSFNQTRTATGRLSSSEPNLQNIPVRGELGREIRRAFIAPPGACLLAGDYSQIDLRVLAHLSQDPTLLESFQSDEDIHAATAARLFNVPPAAVTADMRRLAKTVNFGVIYGMSGYGLQQATELSREEAAQFIHAYFEKHSGVRDFLETTRQKARRDGYVETLLGRRRYIPDINSPNRVVREAAERMAINMPVQGTSADIIKVAMIDLCRQMDRLSLKSKMLLQVHDELLFEVPLDEADAMRELVPRVMSAAVTLSVPVRVEIKQCASWGEME
ncbi:MAG: DNA polymerase I [Chloroflexi bacterium]|nr:DNA polymerase I [Chloroflexota bacterium]